VVGSRASDDVQQARAERLSAWALERRPRRWTRFLLPTGRILARSPAPEVIGSRAIRAIPKHSDQTHADVLALIDELVSLGPVEGMAPVAAPGSSRRSSGRQPELIRYDLLREHEIPPHANKLCPFVRDTSGG
jgi:hypothetical protein